MDNEKRNEYRNEYSTMMLEAFAAEENCTVDEYLKRAKEELEKHYTKEELEKFMEEVGKGVEESFENM